MGKVVKAAIGIGIAVAIAVAAPYLAPGIISAFGSIGVTVGLATATSIAMTALSVISAFALQALAPAPRTASQAPVGWGWARSMGILLPFGQKHEKPPVEEMAAKPRSRWLDPLFWPWESIAIGGKSRGSCMAAVALGSWPVIDRDAPIRRGDYFVFGIDDYRSYAGPAGKITKEGGMGKRFVGVDPERGVMLFECTTPPTRMETGLNRLTFAHRVRATADTEAEARRIAWAIRRDDTLHQDRLANEERISA